MVELAQPFVWFAIAGAAGGGLNAVVSHNVFLWPSRVDAFPRGRIVRPGLVLNIVIGAAASLGALSAFTGTRALTAMSTSVQNLALPLVGAALAGVLASRWITDQADKRLLRVALSHACAAPAAHPDTVRAMERVSPYEVFELANALVPRFRPFR